MIKHPAVGCIIYTDASVFLGTDTDCYRKVPLLNLMLLLILQLFDVELRKHGRWVLDDKWEGQVGIVASGQVFKLHHISQINIHPHVCWNASFFFVFQSLVMKFFDFVSNVPAHIVNKIFFFFFNSESEQ